MDVSRDQYAQDAKVPQKKFNTRRSGGSGVEAYDGKGMAWRAVKW
jgi:hypothetical protein